jgi:SpoVK/Ycf46/Vps4 family AAA+-type ATPase
VRRSLVDIPIAPDEPPSKWVLSKAFESHLPILVEAPSLNDVPKRLQDAATLILDTGPLDVTFIRRMVEVLRGVSCGVTIGEDDYRHLDLVDLRMAFRPGLWPNEIVNTLRRYGRENRNSEHSSAEDRPDRREPRLGSSFRARSSAPPSTVIEPSTDPTAPRVEALAGYGEALTWAEDLKLDLEDWRDGRVLWPNLSPRLLMSGPPGTGKTTWAKALCNSLQLPLFATSAADWLTGGHLGEVLAAMDRAFGDAVRRAPSILFIDEIDGIGTRERSTREYDDYWTSVVNKALQLMDGAIRTEGVILIGATNRPGALDPALRRAGRLERHIAIPKPDTATLAAILAHHLGDDLLRLDETHDNATESKP